MEKTLAELVETARVAHAEIAVADAVVSVNQKELYSAMAVVDGIRTTLDEAKDAAAEATAHFFEVNDEVLIHISKLKINDAERNKIRGATQRTIFPKP